MVALITSVLCLLLLVSSTASSKVSLTRYEFYSKKYKNLSPFENHLKLARLERAIESFLFLQESYASDIQYCLDQKLIVSLPLVESYNYLAEKLQEKDFNIAILRSIMGNEKQDIDSLSLIKRATGNRLLLEESKKFDLESVKINFNNMNNFTLHSIRGISISWIVAYNARLLDYEVNQLESFMKNQNKRTFFFNEAQVKVWPSMNKAHLKRIQLILQSYKVAANGVRFLIYGAIYERLKFPIILAEKYDNLLVDLLLATGKVVVAKRELGRLGSLTAKLELNRIQNSLTKILESPWVPACYGGILHFNSLSRTILAGESLPKKDLQQYNALVACYNIKNLDSKVTSGHFGNVCERDLNLNLLYHQRRQRHKESVELLLEYMKANVEQIPMSLIFEINKGARKVVEAKELIARLKSYESATVLTFVELDQQYSLLKKFNPNVIRQLISKTYNPYMAACENKARYMNFGIPASHLAEYYAYQQQKQIGEDKLPIYKGPPSYDSLHIEAPPYEL